MAVAELVRPPARGAARRTSHIRSDRTLETGDDRVTINLRAPAQARDLIDCAAAVEGKSRTEFMLDSACRHAQEVLLTKRLFVLEGDKYDQLIELLDAPPPPNGALKRLLLGKSPWEK